MNKDLLESQWTQIREILKEKFSNLSEEDIRQINGHYDQLVAKLQQKYGYTMEEAEERIKSWNFDRFATPKSRAIREESFRREQNSSFYKWLLALGIPLLLLGAYYFGSRTPEIITTPPVVQQQVVNETASDRLISDNLRNALLALPVQNMSFAIQNVQINTNNGVVTLSGSVPSATIRDLIGNTAQNFAGVKQVVNHLEVK